MYIKTCMDNIGVYTILCMSGYNFISIATAHMKCVVSSMVLPSLCFTSKSQVALLAYGSIPLVGSSNTIISDPPTRAIPTLSLRFIPPERFLACLLLLSFKRRSFIMLSTSAFTFLIGNPYYKYSP